MKLLLDTHILLWGAEQDERLPAEADKIINDAANDLYFSVASLWEVVIKRGRNKRDFQVEPQVFRRNLLSNSYAELAIRSEHIFHVGNLPHIHRDPFDRMLIAQATVEGLTLLTADITIAQYPGPIKKV